MGSSEERQTFVYPLSTCLQDFALPLAETDHDTVRKILDDAYRSVSIPPQYIERHPSDLNAFIASFAGLTVLAEHDISIFATLMQETRKEKPIDQRLIQWRDFGRSEDSIRQATSQFFDGKLNKLRIELLEIQCSGDYAANRFGNHARQRDENTVLSEIGQLEKSINMLRTHQAGRSGEKK